MTLPNLYALLNTIHNSESSVSPFWPSSIFTRKVLLLGERYENTYSSSVARCGNTKFFISYEKSMLPGRLLTRINVIILNENYFLNGLKYISPALHAWHSNQLSYWGIHARSNILSLLPRNNEFSVNILYVNWKCQEI